MRKSKNEDDGFGDLAHGKWNSNTFHNLDSWATTTRYLYRPCSRNYFFGTVQ
jgi:hypothetical protein